MKAVKHQCEGKIYNGYKFYRCNNGAAFEHEGKMFCGMHHPPTADARCAARRAKEQAAWNAKQALQEKAKGAKMEVARRASMFDELLTTLIEVQHYITDNSHRGIQMQEKISALIAKAEAAK